MSDGRALIDNIVRVWNARDREGILRTYADDAIIEMPGGARVEGREAIERWLDGRLAQLGDFRTNKVVRAAEGEWVCVEYETHFGPAGETPVHVRGAEVYRVSEDGLIREQRQYNFVVDPGVQLREL
ncbi:MAG: SnoaL-like domain [Thermoleophilaceae bacterium]|jgi:uncharacterized protein (TIGR02246 family)|nr:SnoaL-like domain [Thermoleophilaceae bacterium]